LGLLLAGLLWAAQGPPGNAEDRPTILVSGAEVAHQRARWEKMRGRPPTDAELKNAVDGYVRNEILYREALSRDMDRDDPRIRLALIQKMQMLTAGQADAIAIPEQDLIAFYALRKEQYKSPAKLSIKQVFFKDENGAQERAEKLLAEFVKNEPADATWRESGDSSLLEPAMLAATALDLEKQFGTDFTAEVLSFPSDRWMGPVHSGYGWHVVRVFDRVPGRVPELAEVRSKVENDLLYETRKVSEEQGYQEIAGKYRVLISDGAEQMFYGGTK
jgi:hypothetical protein